MSKSFINKQNGTKPNAISRWLPVLLVLGCWLWVSGKQPVQAAETYTQAFQNDTATLSGKSVQTNMYFTKMDYWTVKKATFNFNYQISQLASRDTSDITVSINGVKFDSFRPQAKTGEQTETITIPLNLLKGQNELEINGQILNQAGTHYDLAQTPANWLTIEGGSNVNFEYDLKEADNTVHSFYDHFSGQDTIAHQKSRIVLPNQPTAGELTAGMIALSGESRVITTQIDQIPVKRLKNMAAQQQDYIMVVAQYKQLPQRFKKQISAKAIANHGVIKTDYTNGKHYLIVTAPTASLLKQTARFVANQELMRETNKATETVGSDTATFTSSLQDNSGVKQLATTSTTVTGVGHHETSYLVSLPNDRSNADGTTIQLHLRYSQNLNFKRSLVTASINNQTIGSQKLSLTHTNGDTFVAHVPRGMALGNTFTVRVAFDLEMKDHVQSDNTATPWAEVSDRSKIHVKSEKSNDLLFTNYPTLFIKNETYNDLAVVIPKHLDGNDFKTLTNVFNLIGNFAKSNTGSIQFYTKTPSKQVLAHHNVIVVGTPQNNALVKQLNHKLYFQYNRNFKRLISNEKLSIERDYGKTIGTAQLLRSPYNSKRGLLVVTGANTNATYLASTQINFQKNIRQFTGDAIVVDANNSHYGYRFKKNKYIDASLNKKELISKNSQLILYLGLAVLMLGILGATAVLVIRKQGLLNGGKKHV